MLRRRYKMRRRKKDKTKDKVPTNSTEHGTLDSSGRGGAGSKSKDIDAANSDVTVTVSPPQQRKRSLLGSLGSMRDLVEQVSRCRDCEVMCVPLVRFVSLPHTMKSTCLAVRRTKKGPRNLETFP